jgi:hypothetical protein
MSEPVRRALRYIGFLHPEEAPAVLIAAKSILVIALPIALVLGFLLQPWWFIAVLVLVLLLVLPVGRRKRP